MRACPRLAAVLLACCSLLLFRVPATHADPFSLSATGNGAAVGASDPAGLVRPALAYRQAVTDSGSIEIFDVSGRKRLEFGIDPSATDGLDAHLGETDLGPVPESGTLDARWVGPALGNGSAVDIRGGQTGMDTVIVHEISLQQGEGLTAIGFALAENMTGRLESLEGEPLDREISGTGAFFIVDRTLRRIRLTVTYGIGMAPRLELAPDELSFGLVNTGSSRDASVTATNTGKSDLAFESFSFRNGSTSLFQVVSGGGSNIPPGESRTLTLRFAPTAASAVLDTLIVRSNAAGNPDRLPLSGAGARIIVSPAAPKADAPLEVTVGEVSGFTPTSGFLYYRRGGDVQFDSVSIPAGSPGSRASIPQSAVTERGIEMYVALTDGEQTLTVPARNPKQSPTQVQVEVTSAPFPTTARQYRMVTVPLDFRDAEISNVFRTLGEASPSRWRLLRWDETAGTDGDYVDAAASGATLCAGCSYWLITSNDAEVTFGPALSVPTAAARIVLQPGLNQIGNPFAFPVPWSAVTALLDPSVQAEVGAPRKLTPEGDFEPDAAVLEPWAGYFVENRSANPIELRVPPLSADGITGQVPVEGFLADVSYALQISAAAPGQGLKDRWNYVGFAEAAAADADRLDFREVPGIDRHLRVGVVEGGTRFDGNFKPPTETGQYWDLEVELVRGAADPEPVTLQLHEEGVRPAGFESFVVLPDNRVAPVKDGRVTLDVGSAGPARLRLIVGTPEYAQATAGEMAATPRSFALEKNAPNPFGAETRIRYAVPEASEVKVEVFNLLGRHVRTLVSGRQEVGTHTATWDGADGAGHPVASGVYLCRMTAPGFTSAIRLTLVR